MSRYDPVARGLHWAMALLLAGLVALGLYMSGLPFSPERVRLYSWHKWAGITAFLLVMARLAWRQLHPPPPLPASVDARTRAASRIGHGLLYALMVAIPLTGWLMSSAKGVPTVYFGVLPLPDLVGRDKALGELLGRVHAYLNYGLITLVVVHVAAALKHHFVDRDEVLARMVPFLRRSA